MNPKTYVFTLLILCCTFLAYFFNVSEDMEKFSGSNTRLSGMLESEYGWNQSQVYFSPANIDPKGSIDSYTAPVDLLVVGDSFSYLDNNWLYYLEQKFGLSFQFLHIDNVSMAELLNSSVFQENPPKYLVLSSEEQQAYLRFRRIGNDINNLNIHKSNTASFEEYNSTREISSYFIERDTVMTFQSRMAATGDFLIKKVVRKVLGEKAMHSYPVSHNCKNCFSNTEAGYFLSTVSRIDQGVYDETFKSEAIHSIINLKRMVESNGFTHFYSTVFPKKIHAYENYIAEMDGSIKFTALNFENEMGFVDLKIRLQDAISHGVQDIYLPNDHHLGSTGFEVVSTTLADVMFDDVGFHHKIN